MQKQKHYLTAKRRWEIKKKKAMVLVISVLAGVVSIGIAYNGAITPTMAESYDLTAKTPRNAILSVSDGKEMTIKEHIWHLLTEEGGLTFDEAIEAMAVVDCESKFNPYAIGDSGKSTGLWQIHSDYHKDISIKDTFDAYASTRWSINKYKECGRSWRLWTCGR